MAALNIKKKKIAVQSSAFHFLVLSLEIDSGMKILSHRHSFTLMKLIDVLTVHQVTKWIHMPDLMEFII